MVVFFKDFRGGSRSRGGSDKIKYKGRGGNDKIKYKNRDGSDRIKCKGKILSGKVVVGLSVQKKYPG